MLKKIDGHALKLKKVFEKTLALIDEYHPDDLAIEAPFFGKNIQSMLKLGRAQGVAMAAGLHRTIPIFEYSPKKIKQSITGNGIAVIGLEVPHAHIHLIPMNRVSDMNFGRPKLSIPSVEMELIAASIRKEFI